MTDAENPTEVSAEDSSRVFRALSVESRLRIVTCLCGRSRCVNALSKRLGVSAGAVSQHLRVLKDAGLVECDRRGCFVHYRLSPGACERVADVVKCVFTESRP